MTIINCLSRNEVAKLVDKRVSKFKSEVRKQLDYMRKRITALEEENKCLRFVK